MGISLCLPFLLSLVQPVFLPSQSSQNSAIVPPLANSKKHPISVWVIRPTMKRAPTPSNLARNPEQWSDLQGFNAEHQPFKEDGALLSFLRNANPALDNYHHELRLTMMSRCWTGKKCRARGILTCPACPERHTRQSLGDVIC